MQAPQVTHRPVPVNARSRRYVLGLAAVFGVLAVLLGIAPWHRQDWLLENALVAAALLVLWAVYRYLPFSRVSWSLVFVFLCLHEIGAHYTYSKVPYEAWWHSLTGTSLNGWMGWERNQFDRLIHFFYGLLLAGPIREIFLCLVKARGFWSYFLPLDLTLSTSALYEMIEWAVALAFGGDLGVAYLGTQGDPWDAQKDMALATAGALLAMLVLFAINLRSQRGFAREWKESLKVELPPEFKANAP